MAPRCLTASASLSKMSTLSSAKDALPSLSLEWAAIVAAAALSVAKITATYVSTSSNSTRCSPCRYDCEEPHFCQLCSRRLEPLSSGRTVIPKNSRSVAGYAGVNVGMLAVNGGGFRVRVVYELCVRRRTIDV